MGLALRNHERHLGFGRADASLGDLEVEPDLGTVVDAATGVVVRSGRVAIGRHTRSGVDMGSIGASDDSVLEAGDLELVGGGPVVRVGGQMGPGTVSCISGRRPEIAQRL